MEYPKLMWVLVLTVFVGALGASIDTTEPPTTTPEDEYQRPRAHNSYTFAFETENGQMRDENIQLDPESSPRKMEVNVKGSYSFISADGYEYTVYYKADKKGFRPYVTAHKIDANKDKTA